MSYFTQGQSSGGALVKEDMIKVLKSYEKEGAPVMTFQVGGMICDMPVLETEQGWISRGISCNGSVYTPEQAHQAKKDQYLDAFRKQAESNKTNPPPPVNGEQITGIRVDGDHVFIEVTIVDVGTSSDVEPAQLEEWKRNIDVEFAKIFCSDKDSRDILGYDIEFVYNFIASDKTPITVSTIDKDRCKLAASNYLGQSP
jgi:hypothetical protein